MSATASNLIESLYPAHLQHLGTCYDEALADNGYDAVVLGAGTQLPRIFDDQHYPFSPVPTFVQWLPCRELPDSVLIYRTGTQPVLLLYQPDDIWQLWPAVPTGPWQNLLDIRICTSLADIDRQLTALPGRVACLGEPAQWRHQPAAALINPQDLLLHLYYYRPNRTDYEVACIRAATDLAVPAHRAAEDTFRSGGSEFDILLAFLAACRQTENELPYPAIIAKNTHGAVLHYQHYARQPGEHNSLLIDAGCQHFGYASDITRTYAQDDESFNALITELDKVQQGLARAIAPGVGFTDLHARAHAEIGALLIAAGIITTETIDPVAEGITAAFFPHGLGHFLGLQVHEVGGQFADPSGKELGRDPRYPKLRLLRKLEAGQVLTIEPGIYFIESLLQTLRDGPLASHLNWPLITHLQQFGGIRIEDNVLVTADGQENLTRSAFGATA